MFDKHVGECKVNQNNFMMVKAYYLTQRNKTSQINACVYIYINHVSRWYMFDGYLMSYLHSDSETGEEGNE